MQSSIAYMAREKATITVDRAKVQVVQSLTGAKSTSQAIDFGRHRLELPAPSCCRFVDEIDRLVGKEPVADVTRAERHRCDDGCVALAVAKRRWRGNAQPRAALPDAAQVVLERLGREPLRESGGTSAASALCVCPMLCRSNGPFTLDIPGTAYGRAEQPGSVTKLPFGGKIRK